MKNTNYFKNKKVAVIGLARSGLACANLLFDLGAVVNVTDIQDSELTRSNAAKLKSKDILVELGRHTREAIKNRDFVVVSPGVGNNSLAIIWAEEQGIPVMSEIELASMLCEAQIIAITGSNGKTTVTTLIGKVLEAAGKKVLVSGNVGNPFCRDVCKMQEGDYVSLEVSSFQLERIHSFKPRISVILNFSRNHLDRYKDMQEYLAAKKRIFLNQDKSDYLVLNQEDPALRKLARESKAKIEYFKEGLGLNTNQAAVLAIANILGINKTIVSDVFRKFKGIEHRLEFVAEINNIKFINDSKATTVESVVWALKNIPEPIVLIAGGMDKGLDYGVIARFAQGKVKEAVLIGQAKEKIKNALQKYLAISEACGLEDAVNQAYNKARPGYCVLLSPMCSSFDMFANYEERGQAFKNIVHDLARKNKVM